MKYICLVYQDQNGLDSITDQELDQTMIKCGEWVQGLEKQGKHVFSAGLQSPSMASTVKQRNGKLVVTDGPFYETKEVLGGFTIIEARDLNEAIQIASRFPGSEWGTVEVRPLFDDTTEMPGRHDKRIADAIKRLSQAATV